MKRLVLRDDDTSFFTEPWMLEVLYSELWSAGIPVCLSVIPYCSTNIRLGLRTSLRYWSAHDRCIPPRLRGLGSCFAIADNSALVEFLQQLVRDGLVEISLHGYRHIYREFDLADEQEAQRLIHRGLALLTEAVGEAQVAAFVPPHEALSAAGLEALLRLKMNVCTSSKTLAASMPPSPGDLRRSSVASRQPWLTAQGSVAFPSHGELFHFWGNHWREYRRGKHLVRVLPDGDTLVLTNHFHYFLNRWHETREELLSLWKRLAAQLIQSENISITTFTAIAQAMSFDAR